MQHYIPLSTSNKHKDWTATERGGANKQKYYMRRLVWECIARHVRAGHTASSAMDRIRHHYGRSLSVNKIINAMIADKKTYKTRGGYHPDLRV